MITLSLIIPTYNEKDNICILVPKLISLLEANSISFEILIVDDDSKDLTWKVAQETFAKDSRIRTLRRVGKKGLSSAVLDGMAISQGKFYAVMDADMQHDENILPKMVAEIPNYDIVVGSRLVDEGGYGEWGIVRKSMSQLATLLAKMFFPIPVKDPMSGYFIVKKELYEELVQEINPRGFKILLEFLGRKKGIKAKEVGYVFKTRVHGETKMSGSVIKNYLAALYDIRFGKYISLVFLAYATVGMIGLAINYITRYLYTIFTSSNEPIYLAGQVNMNILIGFEISVLTNYVLNNNWTFKPVKITGFHNNAIGFIKFNFVSIIGLVIQLSVWTFFINLVEYSLDVKASPLVGYGSHFIGIVFATATNYFLNRSITWGYEE
jgi:dolichol-phosphate mannosyltransferase